MREPGEVGLGVGPVLDRVVGVEELRRVDVGADVLDHDIRRVAPAADGDVPVGLRKAFERGAVRALHDFDAGLRREGEAAGIDCFRAGQVRLECCSDPGLARGGPVFQAEPVGSAGALVDAERSGLGRLQPEQVFAD